MNTNRNLLKQTSVLTPHRPHHGRPGFHGSSPQGKGLPPGVVSTPSREACKKLVLVQHRRSDR